MTNVGTNLAAVNYWSTEEPFIDRVKTASGWIAKDASGNDITSTLTLDSHGDLASQAGVAKLGLAVEMDPKSTSPDNEYVLTYDGTATVSISSAKIVSQTAGKVVFDYIGGDDKPAVVISFTGLNASDPVGDAHVVRSDQQDLFNAGEIFNPDFVAQVAKWGMVRFMDWENTNASDAVSWGTRTTLASSFWSQSTTTDGVPLEAMVKLANEAHVDMWYNVPTKADDAYVTNALTYIRDNLDPSLQVHVEYSNEVWNTSFAASAYANTQAQALWGSTISHGNSVYYGYRAAQIADIAQDLFTGTHASQLDNVLAGQITAPLTYILQGIAKAGLGTASSLFHDYAVAPYFGSEIGTGVQPADEATILAWAKEGAAGLDAAFHELEYGGSLSLDRSLATIDQWIATTGTLAKAAGLNLVAYEGGISLSTTHWDTADKATVQAFFDNLLADPRMGDLYTKLVSAFTAAGGTDFVAYNDTGSATDSGSWGMLDSIYQDGSARADALLAVAANSGTAHSDIGSGLSQTLSALKIGGLVSALGGDDVLLGGPGSDTLDGGDGNDHIVGSSGSQNAAGALVESDFYMGGAGSDTIIGGIGNDHIYGNELTAVAGSVDGADSLSGGAGNDYVQGNAGNDTIDGGDGNDRLYGGAESDSILGGAGNDYLQGNKGNDIASGGTGDDVVHGGADNDQLSGDAGNDQLFGDAGNDTLSGGDGNDELTGGAGIDVLTGGSGSDHFLFAPHDAAFVTNGPTDEITDFTVGADLIGLGFHPALVLQGATTTVLAASILAGSLLATHAGQADVAAYTVGSDTYLFYDSTGHGGAVDSAIKVDGLQAGVFNGADFL